MGSIPTRSRQFGLVSGLSAAGRPLAFLGILAGLASPPPARAQEPAVPDSAGAAAAPTIPASLEASPDTLPRPPVTPMGAFVRSLVVPGWGQVAADQPARGAFYFTMEAGSLFMLLKSQSKLDAAERAVPADSMLIASRKGQVEDWAVLAGFWALFAGIDAWVSAQLWDFQAEVVPPPDGSSGVAFRYSVPVGP